MKSNSDLEQRKALHSADHVARFQKKSPARIRKLIDRMIINGLDVVDFGCGDAVIIEYLKESVGSYKGVDFSDEFIEVAKGKINRSIFFNIEICFGARIDFGHDISLEKPPFNLDV